MVCPTARCLLLTAHAGARVAVRRTRGGLTRYRLDTEKEGMRMTTGAGRIAGRMADL